jgi:hypothetical protein
MLTLISVGVWFAVGRLGLVRNPTRWHMVVADVVVLAYLMFFLA